MYDIAAVYQFVNLPTPSWSESERLSKNYDPFIRLDGKT